LNIPEILKMPSISGLGKRPQGILQNQSTRGFVVSLILSLVFKTVFGIFLSPLVCLRSFFQNNVFKLQEVFSEHGIRVLIENGLGSFQTLIIVQI
jgi:hypothetical protein